MLGQLRPFTLAGGGTLLLAVIAASQVVLLLCAIWAVPMASAEDADAAAATWDPDDAEDLDGTGAPSHRVEFRISDPETQCDKSKPGHDGRSWMTEMGNQRNYLGLLDFGRMEAEGVLEMGGYEFEYDADVVSFTDLYSTACEPPVVVFFDDQDQVVDTVDPRGLSMTSLVKELAVRGIKSHVRAAPDGGSSGHLQEVWDDRHTKQPPGIRSREVGTEKLKKDEL